MASSHLLAAIIRSTRVLSLHLRRIYPHSSLSLIDPLPHRRSISSSISQIPPNTQAINPNPRTRTPLEKQFETWIQKLKPGFTPLDVNEALQAQSDPDLALDIFRWTAQQRGYKHNHLTYLAMIKQLISGRRYRHAETLVEEDRGKQKHPTC